MDAHVQLLRRLRHFAAVLNLGLKHDLQCQRAPSGSLEHPQNIPLAEQESERNLQQSRFIHHNWD